MITTNPQLNQLRERVEAKTAEITVVGLGYVGVPVAVSFAAAGFRVKGLDRQKGRVDALNDGKLPLATSEPGLQSLLESGLGSHRFEATTDEDAALECDVAIVAVDTPVASDHRPDPSQLAAACGAIARASRRARAVVIESTIAPGTMEHVVAPQFASSAVATFLIHCPERVRPGRLLRNLRTMSRVIGVTDSAVGLLATSLYSNIVDAGLLVTDWQTAEVIKTAENAARDVQISLANQLAIVCDYAGVDFRRVRDQINQVWHSEPLNLEAGPGVGGHCLPKDPYLLISHLPEEASSALIRGARALNDAMPRHVVRILTRALNDHGVRLQTSRVAVLGLTYDANSDDQRNAPGPRIADLLVEGGIGTILRHDPFVTRDDLVTALAGADAAIVVIPHDQYRTADWFGLRSGMRTPLVIDCRRALEGDALRSAGFAYSALGLGAMG